MKKTFLLLTSVAALACNSARAESLMDALNETYKNNPTLQAQRAYLRSVDENVAIAKSGYRPNIYLQGSYGEGNTDDKNVGNDYDYNNSNLSANVKQSIFSGFQTINAVRSADSLVKSEQSNLYNVEQQVLLSGAAAYLDVLRDTAIVDLQKNNEQLLKKRLDETIQRFNVGEVTRTDVSQSKARFSRAQSDRINAEGVLEASKALYFRIIGSNPQDLSEPSDIKNFVPNSFEEALNYTKSSNYNVKQAKNYLNSKTYDVAKNTGELLPSVDLTGSVSNNKMNADSWANRDAKAENYEVVASATMPLYNSGESRAKIRQSKYQKWQAHEQVLAAERQAVETVTSSWEYMLSNDAKIKSIQDQVKANEIALDGVQKEESLGNRTVLDVLDAYQELLNSNVEEVKARRDYYVSVMNLLLSMGKFTAKDLKLNVPLYDAEKYSEETRDRWFSTGIDTDK